MRRLAVVTVVTLLPIVAVFTSSARSAPAFRTCGPSWTVAAAPAPAGASELFGATATSATDALAVGYAFDAGDQVTHTLIEHWDGTSWSIEPSADGPNAPTSSLAGAVALAPDDAWAVGGFSTKTNLQRTLVEHWDGSAWTRVPSPNAGHPAGGSLSGVAAVAPDDAWAVGGYGQGAPGRTLVEHWDGTSWTVVPSPNKGPYPNSLAAVAASSSDDVWAVGSWFTREFVDQTLVLHWDGVRWRRVASPNVGRGENRLSGVAAVATDEVWAVGGRGLRTLVERWDGASWSVVPSPTPGGNAGLSAVAALAPDDVWAVGGRVDVHARALRTLAEHWDGSRWRVVTTADKGASDNELSGLAAAAGHMVAVGYRFRAGGTGPITPLVLERC